MARRGTKSGYLPGLDGLRAIAILAVLCNHDLPWVIAGHSNAAWKGLAGWGVELFFAISGVLICWRLLEDEAKTGHIQLRGFYVRRLLRIQPAALVYLLAVALLFFSGWVGENWKFWWGALLSTMNFQMTDNTPAGPQAFVGHFWTLAVEEHFYILLSGLLFFFRKHRVLIFLGLLLLLTDGQGLARDHGYFQPHVSDRRTYWIIQLLLIPAVLALLLRMPRFRYLADRYLTPWAATLLIVALMLLHQAAVDVDVFGHSLHQFSFGNFLQTNVEQFFFGFGLWVIAVMLHPKSLTTRFLEVAPLKFIGRLSYSIYLWHVLFFIPVYLGASVHSRLLLVLAERPWKYVATFLAALASYYWVEKPLIRLGHRLAPPASAGHADLEVAPAGADVT